VEVGRLEIRAGIETEKLHKRDGRLDAVAGLDLAVPEGCIYALFGPSAAEKTTTRGCR